MNRIEIPVYKILPNLTDDQLNALAEAGWEVFLQSPFILAKNFTLPEDNELVASFARGIAARLNKLSKSAARKNQLKLEADGFVVKKIAQDNSEKPLYEIGHTGEVANWRVEFEVNADNGLLSITFGPINFNSPSLAHADIIDRNVPKEIIDNLLSLGIVQKDVLEQEEGDA